MHVFNKNTFILQFCGELNKEKVDYCVFSKFLRKFQKNNRKKTYSTSMHTHIVKILLTFLSSLWIFGEK